MIANPDPVKVERALAVLFGGAAVQWIEHRLHTAKSGRVREVLEGIPLEPFWKAWRQNREGLAGAGVTLWAGAKAATGQFRTHNGHCREIMRRQWTVSLWRGPANDLALAAAGFESLAGVSVKKHEKTACNGPF